MTELELRAGDLLDGRYRIEGRAGRGGTADVYRGRDVATGAVVALKVLEDDRDWARLERERAALARVDHPGVIRVLELATDADDRRYAVLPWCEGTHLGAAMDGDGVSAPEALTWIADAAEVVAMAHAAGVVHRDLKPGHLWRRRDGSAAVIDFGIARTSTAPRVTRTGTTVGTPGYMAPEQIIGDEIDPRVDVFALGCVLYEALTGSPAFAGTHAAVIHGKTLWTEPAPLVERCPEAPPALATLVHAMLAKTPAARPDHGGAVADALRAMPALAAGPRRRRNAAQARTQTMATPATVAIGLRLGSSTEPLRAPAIELPDGSAIAWLGDDAEVDLRAIFGPDRVIVTTRDTDIGAALERCAQTATQAAASGDVAPPIYLTAQQPA